MSEFLKSIVEPLHASATVSRIYGEPVTAHGRTIIPVARVRYGFGGGAGHGAKREEPVSGEGGGEGGGGGVMASPVGVIEITDQHTRFIPLHSHLGVAAAAFLGIGLGMLFSRRKRS